MSLGISLVFGLLDVANIAQPAFLILGSYSAYVLNGTLGLDPILAGLLVTPLFYLLGAAALGDMLAPPPPDWNRSLTARSLRPSLGPLCKPFPL